MNTLPFPVPISASEMVALMERIWHIHDRPAPDGQGIVLYVSRLYDDWHDARKTVRACGFMRTGSTKFNNEWVGIYRKGVQAVLITPDGNGIIRHDGRSYGPRGISAKTEG